MADEPLPGDIAHFHTHPAHLAAVAVLCGLPAPPVANGRVLELACGSGFNLLAMAQSLPGATFDGLDRSEAALRHGRATADAVGATNVQLHAGWLDELDAIPSEFDFIVAHGVFSQLPPDGQTALLKCIRDRLAPNGIGYVSYNVLPGSNVNDILREVMRLFAGGDAKAAVRHFLETLPEPESDSAKALKAAWQSIENEPDAAVAENDRPFSFGDFARMLAENGLQYVAESRYGSGSFAQIGADRKALEPAGDDLIRRECYLDLRLGRTFRQSLVCRADRAVPRTPNPVDAANLWLSPRVELVQPNSDPDATDYDDATWEDDGTAVQIHDPLYRQLLRRLQSAPGRRLQLAACRPVVNEILGFDVGDEQAMKLLTQVAHKGTIEEVWFPYAAATSYAAEPDDRPRACALARRQAASTSNVTNRLHRAFPLAEAERSLLLRLDGTASRVELARALTIGRTELDRMIGRLAAAALIEA